MIIRSCPKCGTGPWEQAVEGLCPVCLLSGVLEERPDGAPEFFSEGSGRPAPDSPDPASQVGPYTVVRPLGEGGMGVVYLARQKNPISRLVALKVVRPGLDSNQVLTRFEGERQALALMDHPGIARVFDAGTTEDKRPYFAMEYVDGLPITDYCNANRLDTRERLELFRQVCLAVHHAHSRGVIHRDIKPTNVLVTTQDGAPAVKVIDFGIAKALRQRLTERTLFTERGLLIGTPEYMSPEQAELGDQHGDTASDIYSLGVLLYELLVGSLPLDARELRRGGYLELLRAIRDEEPPRLAEKLRTMGPAAEEAARLRRTDARSLHRQVRGDLEWITLRAMDKDRSRRYPSASEFAADIGRHLEGDPVLAGPPSRSYRAGKLVRKHRGAVAGAAVLLACILGGLAVSSWLYVREQRQRDRAETQGYLASLANADELIHGDDYAKAREQLFQCTPRLRGWEWHLLYALSDTSVATLHGTGDPLFMPGPSHFAFSRDSGRVYFTMRRTVHEWRSDSWTPTRSFGIFGRVLALAEDASRLATRVPQEPDVVRVLNPMTGATLANLQGHRDVATARFSRDATLLATVSADGAVRVWDPASGAQRLELPAEGADLASPSLAFSADGRLLAASASRVVRLAHLGTGHVYARVALRHPVSGLAFRPDGKQLAIADAGGSIGIWDPASPGESRLAWEDADSAVALTFDAQGGRLATGLRNGAVRIWDSETGSALATLSGLDQHEVAGVAFSPDGRFVLAGSRRGAVRVWNLQEYGGGGVLEQGVIRMASSGDGRWLALAQADRVLLAETATARRVRAIPCAARAVALDRAGALLACGDDSGRIQLVDPHSGSPLAAWTGHDAAIRAIALAPDGRLLATTAEDRTLAIWEVPTGRARASLSLPEEAGVAAFSPDGRRLATGLGSYQRSVRGGAVVLREVAAAEPVVEFPPEWPWGEIVRALAFSRDGRRLAAGEYASGTVRVFDAASGELLGDLAGHSDQVTAVTFSPDGRLIASAGRDNTIRFWDAARLKPLFALRRPVSAATDLAFDASGHRLFATYADGSLRMWSTTTAYPPAPLELVTNLGRRYALWADVRHHLRTDSTLAASERDAALRLCARRVDWSVAVINLLYYPLIEPSQAPVPPEILVRRSDDMYQAIPWSLDAASFAGAARYRSGHFLDALALLERTSLAMPEDPFTDLFLAMSYARLGRVADARRSLHRARAIIHDLPIVNVRETAALDREAERVVSEAANAAPTRPPR